jgi:hypothetical protein
MNLDDSTERDIARGARAEELLRSELLQEAFAELDATYVQAWRIAPSRDVTMREKLWMAVNIIGLVKDHLGKIAANGKLAQADLKMRESVSRS